MKGKSSAYHFRPWASHRNMAGKGTWNEEGRSDENNHLIKTFISIFRISSYVVRMIEGVFDWLIHELIRFLYPISIAVDLPKVGGFCDHKRRLGE